MNNTAGYEKLHVWQASHEFVLLIYQTTRKFPKDELFGLTNQIRRAAVSIAANIVEGQVRNSSKEFLRFLFIANGSLVEVEYYLKLICDLKYINQEEYQLLTTKRTIIGNLLNGLIKSIQKHST